MSFYWHNSTTEHIHRQTHTYILMFKVCVKPSNQSWTEIKMNLPLTLVIWLPYEESIWLYSCPVWCTNSKSLTFTTSFRSKVQNRWDLLPFSFLPRLFRVSSVTWVCVEYNPPLSCWCAKTLTQTELVCSLFMNLEQKNYNAFFLSFDSMLRWKIENQAQGQV